MMARITRLELPVIGVADPVNQGDDGAFCPPPLTRAKSSKQEGSYAKAFYGELFDWKFESYPMEPGEYLMVSVGEGTGGGMMQHPSPEGPSFWLAYVLVDDINAATSKAKSLDATI